MKKQQLANIFTDMLDPDAMMDEVLDITAPLDNADKRAGYNIVRAYVMRQAKRLGVLELVNVEGKRA